MHVMSFEKQVVSKNQVLCVSQVIIKYYKYNKSYFRNSLTKVLIIKELKAMHAILTFAILPSSLKL